jgi:hypothetical protein
MHSRFLEDPTEEGSRKKVPGKKVPGKKVPADLPISTAYVKVCWNECRTGTNAEWNECRMQEKLSSDLVASNDFTEKKVTF